MKKFLIIVCLLIVIVTGCVSKEEKADKNYEALSEIDRKIEETLDNMTLDEKIGQMLIVFYRSGSFDNTLKSALEDVKPGGFILFKENITNYEDTLSLIKKIKDTAKIPMFISIDEEGGNVQRLLALKDANVTDVPFMSYVGAKDDESLAFDVGKVIAEELRVFGINMDFAPVIDVYSNPKNTVIGKRAFGSNPNLVSRMGINLARGLEDNGVVAVYKHFPGHGDTKEDSHVSLPIVTKTKNELYDLELIPFQKAIKEKAGAIMVAHIAVPNLTGDNTPSSLSKEVVTDLLRNEMKFNGVIISDALNMNAVKQNYIEEEIYVKAVEAGIDMLLMPSSSRKAHESIKKAVNTGRIKEDRIDESVRRILKLKYEKIEEEYNNYLPKEYLNNKEHQDIIAKLK